MCVSEQEQLDAHIVCARRRQARTHARTHASGDVSELAHGSAVYHKMIYNGIILIIKIESRSRVAVAHLRTNGARTRTRAHTKAHHAAASQRGQHTRKRSPEQTNTWQLFQYCCQIYKGSSRAIDCSNFKRTLGLCTCMETTYARYDLVPNRLDITTISLSIPI